MTDDERPDSSISPIDIKRRRQHDAVESALKDNPALSRLIDVVRSTTIAANEPPQDVITAVVKDMVRPANRLKEYEAEAIREGDKPYKKNLIDIAQLCSDVVVLKMTADANDKAGKDVIKVPYAAMRRLSLMQDPEVYEAAYGQMIDAADPKEMQLYGDAVPKSFTDFLLNDQQLLSDIKAVAQDVVLNKGKGASR